MPIKKYNYMVKWEMARSLNGVKKSQELLKRKTKRGGMGNKGNREKSRNASLAITSEELDAMPSHYFQKADVVNVNITRRLQQADIIETNNSD